VKKSIVIGQLKNGIGHLAAPSFVVIGNWLVVVWHVWILKAYRVDINCCLIIILS